MSDWRPIPSAPGYFANSEGQILGKRGRVLRGTLGFGYPRVSICAGKLERLICSHILVCEAFHGPKPTPEHEVAHADGVRSNCRPDNLRWATRWENTQDKKLHGTWPAGEKNGRATITEAQAAEIRRIYSANMGPKYVKRGAREDLAKRFGVGLDVIKAVAAGETWRHVEIDLPFMAPPENGDCHA